MTRYRVTATSHGKRIATSVYWESKTDAEEYAWKTNKFVGGNARVVKDSKRIRDMIP